MSHIVARQTRDTPDIKFHKDITSTEQITLTGSKKNSLDVAIASGMIDFKFDTYKQTQTATTDTHTFRVGGITGTIVGVIVVTWDSASRNYIDTAQRTT